MAGTLGLWRSAAASWVRSERARSLTTTVPSGWPAGGLSIEVTRATESGEMATLSSVRSTKLSTRGDRVRLVGAELEGHGVEAGRGQPERVALVGRAVADGRHGDAEAAGAVPGDVGQRDRQEVDRPAELGPLVEEAVQALTLGPQARRDRHRQLGAVGHGTVHRQRRRQRLLRREDELLADQLEGGRRRRLRDRRGDRHRGHGQRRDRERGEQRAAAAPAWRTAVTARRPSGSRATWNRARPGRRGGARKPSRS